jgi:hypothetical protein
MLLQPWKWLQSLHLPGSPWGKNIGTSVMLKEKRKQATGLGTALTPRLLEEYDACKVGLPRESVDSSFKGSYSC